MFPRRIVSLALAAACLLGLGLTVHGAQTDCDTVYCFSPEDFSTLDEPLTGICITGLPADGAGSVMLGTRVLKPGDILTAQQIGQMSFQPVKRTTDTQAELCYLPIYENRVEREATLSIAVFGKEDKAPVVQDSTLETYKNLPNEGKLCASDPEGGALTYTLVRSPKRGAVEIREDGSFTYTPKHNKVGVDSFTFTATDPAGNVSREGTVTVQILKPTQAKQYTDTIGHTCRFEAEWLRSTGLFEGERLNGQDCFFPEQEVSRGQFLAMVVQLLDIPTQQVDMTQLPLDTPQWLRPYLAAAMRAGLTEGLPQSETGSFCADVPITGAEAAVMLQNALDLTVGQQTLEEELPQDVPTWAASSLTVLSQNGLELTAQQILTRETVAELLYQVRDLAVTAPGTAVFKMQ